MSRLFTVVLICFTTLTALCTLAIFVGHQQAEGFIPELQPCGDSLCYLGILPGTTTWDEGINIIRQAPQLTFPDKNGFAFRGPDPSYYVSFSQTEGDGVNAKPNVFGEINLHLNHTAFYVGDALGKLGPPCFVNTYSNGIMLGYPNSAFFVASGDYQIAPTSHVFNIVLQKATEQLPCPIPNIGLTGGITIYPWLGFRQYPPPTP